MQLQEVRHWVYWADLAHDMDRWQDLANALIIIIIIIIISIIIIIIINCNWVLTRWQWLYYMYTNMKREKKSN